EIRRGKYPKVKTTDVDVLHTVSQLCIPADSSITDGPAPSITVITTDVVERLLQDKRRLELVQPFKLALLKVDSQEAARLIAAGDYDLALPVALEAVRKGQAVFKPAPALQ
ncbi:unnamed protein product, partial [Ostreobium quekettii]